MSINTQILRGVAIAATVLFAASANASLVSSTAMPGSSSGFEQSQQFARKGADDTRPDDRGGRRGRGRDDGRNHAAVPATDGVQVARRGADDGPGHVRRGRGTDDGPGHVRRGRGADDTGTHGRRGRGSDDPSGHGRHGRGSDDHPGDDHGGRSV